MNDVELIIDYLRRGGVKAHLGEVMLRCEPQPGSMSERRTERGIAAHFKGRSVFIWLSDGELSDFQINNMNWVETQRMGLDENALIHAIHFLRWKDDPWCLVLNRLRIPKHEVATGWTEA